MARRILGRLLHAAALCAVVAVSVFLLLQSAPGDPFALALEGAEVPATVRAEWRSRYGLDRPPTERFAGWASALAHGDLGYSASRRQPVAAIVRESLPRTMALVGAALVLGFVGGVWAALVQVRRHRRWPDRAISALTLAGVAIPDFLLALLAMTWLGARWRIFPVAGIGSLGDAAAWPWWERTLDFAWHLTLPALVLSVAIAARVARHQRAALLSVMREDYIRTARAKGLSEWAILRRHALPNAIGPVIALLGLALPSLVGGALLIERIFGWPGMGLALFDGLLARDYPLVVAAVLLAATFAILARTLTDLLADLVAPRHVNSGRRP
ncbi:MAG: ABC transporter permease [Gemmatimonadaceae bacterium]|nr:ABC transporter permease [Gemmatimonadaceae bacterium]